MKTLTQAAPHSAHQLLPVGHTPLLWIKSLSQGNVRVYAKAEWEQPAGSVKARAAHAIIRQALYRGLLAPGKQLLDASSGNTAIAYATLLKPLGLHPVICLPSNASTERKNILNALGAELVYTSPLEGTEGAQQVAREMAETHPARYYYADQYSNDWNWKAHYESTAIEIWNQTSGKITHFVAGLGTTGTFTGTSRRLSQFANIERIALQPNHPFHPMEGWKHLPTAHIPAIYDPFLADQVLEVNSDEVFDMIRFIARHEGLLISPSAAGNLLGARQVATSITDGVIVTILPDHLDRYSEIKKELFTS